MHPALSQQAPGSVAAKTSGSEKICRIFAALQHLLNRNSVKTLRDRPRSWALLGRATSGPSQLEPAFLARIDNGYAVSKNSSRWSGYPASIRPRPLPDWRTLCCLWF